MLHTTKLNISPKAIHALAQINAKRKYGKHWHKYFQLECLNAAAKLQAKMRAKYGLSCFNDNKYNKICEHDFINEIDYLNGNLKYCKLNGTSITLKPNRFYFWQIGKNIYYGYFQNNEMLPVTYRQMIYLLNNNYNSDSNNSDNNNKNNIKNN